MFVLKYIAKLVLIPVWLMLLIIWLPVHLAVGICGMFHGLGRLLLGGLAILAVVLGMWQNAMLFIAFIVGTFLVVLAGTIVEVILEEARHGIGAVIVG